MQVETILVQRVDGDRTTKGVFDELRAWKKLFGRKYRDRTMVGVLIMVFQRTLSFCSVLSSGWIGVESSVCVCPTTIGRIGVLVLPRCRA